MRLNMTQQGGLADEFMSGGGSVINPLFLAADPATPLGASTKQYVDNSAASLNANNLITGTIGAARFPALNGDLTSSAGSTTLALSNTGVTPGAYPKVSVDNKGRILNGLNLVESDLPSMSWNKITSDKPTTVDGYGITNAIKSTGGTMVGIVSVNGTPTQSSQLVNKSYLDTVVGGTTGIAVGDIISKIDPTTPVGFLKCNGAELVKTSYQDLYNAIGDRYTLTGAAGNGRPWQNQYDINTSTTDELLSWTARTSLPSLQGGAVSFATKNRIYIFGGFNGSSTVGIGYTATVNVNGTLGPWAATTSLPGALAYSSCIVVKNKVYILGGHNGSAYVNTVYVADINADGTIGAWSSGPSLPAGLGHNRCFINNNRLYLLTGLNSSNVETNVVYSVVINTDGTLGTWVTEQSLPVTVAHPGLTVIKNKVYIFSGSQSSVVSNVIYSAVLNSDGSLGAWVNTGNCPLTFHVPQIYTTRKYVFLISGSQTGSLSPNVYRCTINDDGSLGSWYLSPFTLPANIQYTNLTVVGEMLYLCGGIVNSAWSSAVYSATLTGNITDYSTFYSNSVETNYMVAGSGRPWQQQYQLNATQTGDISSWVTDSSVLPTALVYGQVVVTKNYVYMLGGWNGSAAANSVYSAPVNTDGTLGTWTAGTNLPVAMLNFQAVVLGNKLYIIGGTNNSSYYSNIYYSVIAADGTIGTWTAASFNLPAALSGSQVVVTRNRIYMLGGYNGSAFTSIVYYATVYPDGSISSWTTGTSLPIAVCYANAVVTKNRVYLMGGYTASTTTTTAVYTAPINSDGSIGAWTNSGVVLPATLGEAQIYTTKNCVYLIGGSQAGTTQLSSVYQAPVNTDGVLGNFTQITSIPATLSQSHLAVTNNHLYLIGGRSAGSLTASIYSATILEGSNDYSSYYAPDTTNYMLAGAGRPWESQYQFNTTQSGDITGWTTSATGVMSIYLHVAIVTKNRVYVGAGNNNSMYTAPINSDGSLGTWTSLGAILPQSVGYGTAVVTKNRAFILGTGTTNIMTAPINADGTIGTWVNVGPTPAAFSNNTTFVTKNKLYVVSGTGAGTNVYYANINADGTLGGWQLNPYTFPVHTNLGRALVTKNRVYFIGGNQGGGGVTNVWTASIDPNGIVGNWVAGPSLLTGVEAPVIIATKNTVVIGGGWTSGAVTNVSQVASIDANGVIGNWSYGTVFPMGFHSCTPIITSSKVHLIGGAIATATANADIFSAPFTGGLNDYSSYMNGNIVPPEQFITVSKFKIPDTSLSGDGLNYFIKY